jgi:hypothetical protein
MSERNKAIDPIPDEFASIEEAATFWDEHSVADYWDILQEVKIEVRAPRRQWIPLASHLSKRVMEQARQEGVSIETLINLWVAERLRAQMTAETV